MPDFFWFSDAQWARIGPLLPTDTRGMARVDDRRVLSGIVHALRNGGRWADCQLRLKISHFCRSKISHFERAVVPPDAVFGGTDLVEL